MWLSFTAILHQTLDTREQCKGPCTAVSASTRSRHKHVSSSKVEARGKFKALRGQRGSCQFRHRPRAGQGVSYLESSRGDVSFQEEIL